MRQGLIKVRIVDVQQGVNGEQGRNVPKTVSVGQVMVSRQRNSGIGWLLARIVLVVGFIVSLVGGLVGYSAAQAVENPQGMERQLESQSVVNPKLWLDVDQNSQIVRAMSGNKPIRVMIASTGRPATPTPDGTFKIQNRGTFFKIDFASAKFFTSFLGWGKYMFHSIIFDKKGQKIQPIAAERLGFKASHGCIRLPIHDAYWIYQNIPQGTKVVIHSQPAPPKQKVSQGKKLPAFSLELAGKRVSFSKNPRWVDGILMAPVQDLSRWIQAKSDWNEKDKQVTIVKDGISLQFPVSIPRMRVAEVNKELKIPALLIYQTVWIPFEPAVSALGYSTKWEGQANRLVAYVHSQTTTAKNKPESPWSMLINGYPVELNITAQEAEGQLLVPIIAFSQALGAQVSQEVYQQQEGALKVTMPRREVVFYQNRELYWVNGVEFTAQTPPRQKDGRLIMGLQDLSKALGIVAEANSNQSTIRITTEESI
ncbi:MAG: stalk domain-containing protein [Carboxydocellales bacterium]